jgi:hypothetical protein
MPPDGHDAQDDLESEDVASIVPLAFSRQEPPCVRIAYLQAVFNNIVGNMPVQQVTDNLCITLSALDAAGVLPLVPKPAQTY